ncbi:hypothetical protein ABPG74_019569 [Tetrahymena malaccensis]
MNTQTPINTQAGTAEKKLKPCCACPETKKLRDACVFNNGEENCKDFIEAHKECLRSKGFNPQRGIITQNNQASISFSNLKEKKLQPQLIKQQINTKGF